MVNARSEFDLEKRIHLTNEIPPYDLFEAVNSVFQTDFWKYILGSTTIEFDLPYQTLKQDGSYERVPENENVYYKKVNGVLSQNYGPDQNDGSNYHRMEIDGVLMPEFDLLLHEVYRYTGYPYPDHPDYNKLLTNNEFNDYINSAAAIIDYKPDNRFFENVIDTLYKSDFLNSNVSKEDEVAMIKIRNLTNEAFRRKLYGSKFGYRMLANDIFENITTYPLATYLPVFNEKIDSLKSEAKVVEDEDLYKDRVFDNFRKSRKINTFSPIYQNKFKLIDWMGDKSVYPEEKDNNSYFTGTSLPFYNYEIFEVPSVDDTKSVVNNVKLSEFIENINQDLEKQGLVSELYTYPFYYSTLDENLKYTIEKDTVVEAHSIRTDFENDIRYNVVYKYDRIEDIINGLENKDKFNDEIKDLDLFSKDKNYLNILYKYSESLTESPLNVLYSPFNRNTLILGPADTISFYPEFITGHYNSGSTILDEDHIDWDKAIIKKEQILSTKQYNSNTYTGMETTSQVIGFTKGKIDFSCIKEDMYNGTKFTQSPTLNDSIGYGIIINNSENNKVVLLGKTTITSLFEDGWFYIKDGTFEITAIPEEKTDSMMRACYEDYDSILLRIKEQEEYLDKVIIAHGFNIDVAKGFNEGKSESIAEVNSHEKKDLYLQFCEKVLEYTDLLDKIDSYRKNKEYIYREKSFTIDGKPNTYNTTLVNNENIIDGFMIGAASYDKPTEITYSKFAAIARSMIDYITLGYLSILPFSDNNSFNKEKYYKESNVGDIKYLKVNDALLQDNENLNTGKFSEMTSDFTKAVVFEDCIKVSSINYDTIRIMSEVEAEGYTISFKDDKAVDLYRTLSIGDKVTGSLIDSDDNDVKITAIGEKYVTVDRKLTKIGKAELVYSIKMNIIGEELDDYPDSYQAYLRKNGTYSSYSPLDNGVWPSEKWPNTSLALTDGLLDITYFNIHNYKPTDDRIGSFINVMNKTHLDPAEGEVLVPSTIKCMRDVFVELNLTKLMSGPDEKGKIVEKLSDYRWLDYIEDNLPRTSRLTDNVNIGVNLTMQTDTSGYMSTISGARYTDPLTKVKFITINQDGSFKWPESSLSDTNWTVPMYAQIGSGGAGRSSWFRTPEDIVYPNLWGNNVYDGVIEGQAPVIDIDGSIKDPGLVMQIEQQGGRFRKRSVWAKDGALLETDLSSPEYLSTEEPLFEVQLGEYNTQTHFFRDLHNTMTTVQVSFYKQAFKNLTKELEDDEKIKVSNNSILYSKAIKDTIEAYDMETYNKVEKSFVYKGQWVPTLIVNSENKQEPNYPSKVDNDKSIIEYYTIENDYNLIHEDSSESPDIFSNGSILFVFTKDNGESDHVAKKFSCINILADTNTAMKIKNDNVSLSLLNAYHNTFGSVSDVEIINNLQNIGDSIQALKDTDNYADNNPILMSYNNNVCWFLYVGDKKAPSDVPIPVDGFDYSFGTLFAFAVIDNVLCTFTLNRDKKFVFSQDIKKIGNVAEEYMNILLGISNYDEFNKLSIVNNIDKANYYFDLPKKYIAEGSYNIKTIINPEFISRGFLYNDDNTVDSTEVSFITTDSAVFYDEANAEFFVYARYYQEDNNITKEKHKIAIKFNEQKYFKNVLHSFGRYLLTTKENGNTFEEHPQVYIEDGVDLKLDKIKPNDKVLSITATKTRSPQKSSSDPTLFSNYYNFELPIRGIDDNGNLILGTYNEVVNFNSKLLELRESKYKVENGIIIQEEQANFDVEKSFNNDAPISDVAFTTQVELPEESDFKYFKNNLLVRGTIAAEDGKRNIVIGVNDDATSVITQNDALVGAFIIEGGQKQYRKVSLLVDGEIAQTANNVYFKIDYLSYSKTSLVACDKKGNIVYNDNVSLDNTVSSIECKKSILDLTTAGADGQQVLSLTYDSTAGNYVVEVGTEQDGSKFYTFLLPQADTDIIGLTELFEQGSLTYYLDNVEMTQEQVDALDKTKVVIKDFDADSVVVGDSVENIPYDVLLSDVAISNGKVYLTTAGDYYTAVIKSNETDGEDKPDIQKQNIPSFDGTKTNERPLYKTDAEGNFAVYIIQGNIWAKVPCKKYKLENGVLTDSDFTKATFWKKINSPMFQDDLRAFISNNDLSVIYSAIDNIHYGALNSTDGMFKTISTLSEYNDLNGDNFTNVVSIYNDILSKYTKVLDFDTFYSYATSSKTEGPLTFNNNNDGKGTLKMNGFIVDNDVPDYSTSNNYEIELNLSTKEAVEDAYKEYLYAIARYVCFETEFITSLESVPVKLEFTESKLYILSNKGTLSCIEKDDIINSNDPSKWTHFSIPTSMYFTAYSEKKNRVNLKYNGNLISFNGDFIKEQVPIYNVKGLYTDNMKAIIYGSVLSQDAIAELYKEKRIEIDVDAETNKIVVKRGSTVELSQEETTELAALQSMSKSKTNTSPFAAFGEGGILMLSKLKESSDWTQDISKDYSFNNVVKMNKIVDGVSRDIYQYYIRIGNKINGRFAGNFADADLSELNFYNFEDNDVRLYNSSFSTAVTSPDAGSNLTVYKADTSDSTVILPDGIDQDNDNLLKSYELLVESSQALSVSTATVTNVENDIVTFDRDLVSYNGNITVILSLLTTENIADQTKYISESDIRKITINGVVPLKLTTQVEDYKFANKMYNKRCILDDAIAAADTSGYPSYNERPDVYKQKLAVGEDGEYVSEPEYYKNAYGNDIILTDYSGSFSYYKQDTLLSDSLLESYNNNLPYLLAPIPLNNIDMYSVPFNGFGFDAEKPSLFLDSFSTKNSNFIISSRMNEDVLNYLFTEQELDAAKTWAESKGLDIDSDRFIYRTCSLVNDDTTSYLYDDTLKCFVIRDDITCSGKVKLPYKFDASSPFKESELSNIPNSDSLPTNIYYNKFGYGGNIEGTIGLPWIVDGNAFTEDILINKKGDPLVLSYYDGSPFRVKDTGEIVIRPNGVHTETTTATKFTVKNPDHESEKDFVFEPKRLAPTEIGCCKKGDDTYYFQCFAEEVDESIQDDVAEALGEEAIKAYIYIEEVENYSGEPIEPIILDNDYIDINPLNAFIFDDNYNLSFTNKTDKYLLVTTNVDGLIYSRVPKYNNYRELLSSEGRSIIYEKYDLEDNDVTIKSVNDGNIELSTSLESLGILTENNKGLSIKLTLKTQSTVTYSSMSDLNERENYIEIQESEINNFPPDRVYFNPVGYPKSPVLVDGNKFYSENSSYFSYTDYTNNNNEFIYCCDVDGRMIKLSIVDGELNEKLLEENDTILNCWVPKTPIYTSCRDWFYNDYYVKGLEKNPYWQEIEIDSTLTDQGTFEQTADVYRFVKKGAKMVSEKVPEGRKLLNINNPVSYVISGDSYIVNKKENFLDLQNGRIRLLLTEPDEYYRYNRNLIEYGISAENILVEQDNSRNIIAPVDIRQLSTIWEDNNTILYSGFLQASYTVNTTKSFTTNKKSDNSVVRVSELGLFNKDHELIAYATFPPIEYNSDTQHISFTMFIKNGTLSEVKK